MEWLCLTSCLKALIPREGRSNILVTVLTGLHGSPSEELRAEGTELKIMYQEKSQRASSFPLASQMRKNCNCKLNAVIWALSAPKEQKEIFL
jgi:hypothetical protein